jgi:hypothetical protein
MDVFLIPLGAERYELYCEPPDDAVDAAANAEPPGMLRGLVERFRHTIAIAERERRAAVSGPRQAAQQSGWIRRMRDRAMCWIAEKVAEQRLLWNLRHSSSATLIYPADLDEAAAMEIVRAALRREAERHNRWLMVDFILFIASGAFMLIPGPNFIAYYFAFRVVGHYFSMRGARQGLNEVSWTTRPSEPLAELRHVAQLEPSLRTIRIREVASLLRLQHLAAFFERTAIPSA